ncbi:putative extragenic suppressor of the bimD6 mutation [Ophiocordyceps camponoti-floridani]|uniref:Serine/threonine-protein kinase RIO1 n=1 Tax=Ophiocordyceps camponoti-floridani TaxID=2030778 RepID=A0A8H4Q0J2_9HYPO|nr:putative extragenic suppressor of the bimD6 mutation [Ophiocordyceps camponoti-floridani]
MSSAAASPPSGPQQPSNSVGTSHGDEPVHKVPPPQEESFDEPSLDDDDLDGVFSDADDGDEQGWSSYGRNRQPQQKPKVNTLASVDDQVAALARHAAKIRLDSVKRDDDREKDKADRATSDQVLDRRTRMILLQMINRGNVSEVHGAISTGKEANVYGAVLYSDADQGPVQRAVKVYKTAILVFKDRERYINGEHRFRGGFDKGNSRKMVKLWAEKEFRNLRRIYAAGIPCPEPIALKLHVLLMGFLGDARGWAYPKLRDALPDAETGDARWRLLYTQLLAIMRRMYQVCRLVHADLSEYNVLCHQDKLYVIDVSQSVEPDHPRSLEFLRMDIKNVGDFFRRKGVDPLPDRAVFDFITTSAGPVDEPSMLEAIERLYETADDEERDAAEVEIDNEVFRRQYIPQTLEQVYDVEKDGQKLARGEGDELVYRNLLADEVVGARRSSDVKESDSGSDSGSDAGADLSNLGHDGFEKGRPRGRRFEDKEEKKTHKQAVKEAKREKRKTKVPKYEKKKMIASTSRKKKS